MTPPTLLEFVQSIGRSDLPFFVGLLLAAAFIVITYRYRHHL
jgi:hypothetical protein